MTIFRTIATLIMSAGFGFFGTAKIVGASIVTEGDGWGRLTEAQWTAIGLVELLAVAGLLAALLPRFRALGIAAAGGLATLTSCAVVYHVVNGDPAGDIMPAVLQGLVATSYVVLGLRAETTSTSTALTVATA